MRKDTDEERDDEIDDSDDSNMDLSKDEPKGDDDAAGFGVFMYNKSTEPPKSTYLSPTVTTSSLEYIQSLLNDSPEIFLDEAAHHISSPPANTTYLPIKDPQPSSLQAKAKKLMQKAKKNMRKINFKRTVA
ncbi:hypothetical protein Tco_0236680 [Tanacetum coccineum]